MKRNVNMAIGLKLLLGPILLTCLKGQNSPENDMEKQNGGTKYPTKSMLTTTSNYYEFYDYRDVTKVGSDYCTEKEVCNAESDEYQGFPAKNCYCDLVCALTNDCCPNFKPAEGDVPRLSNSVLQCVRFKDAVSYPGYGVTMVTRCDDSWPDDEVKSYCESYLDYNDTFSKVPVSEPVHNILFRNMYCSMCNYNYDFKYWAMRIKCNNITEACISEFQSPNPVVRTRMCPLQHVIDSCESGFISHVNQEMRDTCENGSYSLVYAYSSNMYKNKDCALCNGEQPDEFRCEPDAGDVFQTAPPIDPRKHYSFKMLVDFNSGHLTDSQGQIVTATHCKNNEMYDPMFERCREILCPPPLISKNGKCVQMNLSSNVPEGTNNCTFTKLETSEYEFTNDSRVYVFSSKIYFEEEQFIVSGSDVFVCLDINQTCPECTAKSAMFTFDEVESYLSFVTLIISLISLAVTFMVYACFRELLNTPGKILISLVIALFLAQFMFLVSPEVEGNSGLCTAVSVIMHYCFLAAFCWMNVVALDLWMTFSRQFISPGSGSKSMKRFLKFSVYGWFVPLFIISAALCVEFADVGERYKSLRPGYGNGVCWITSRDALLLFFAGPLGVFKLFDIVAFIFTSIHIIRAKRQGAMARQQTSVCSFLINLKLSLVMGLTWVFAFLANIGGLDVFWYLFIVFNCLQGFFIAISFLCTNKVKRLVRNKYEEVSKSKSSTQMTSVSHSNGQKSKT